MNFDIVLMMSNYPFSQLMRENLMQPHDASLKVSVMTPKVSNTADAQIFRTSGGATLSDLFVAPSRRSQATNVSVASRARNKVATRQLRKEGN